MSHFLGISAATGGLLRGAGRAPLGAAVNIVGYYCIGIPVGLITCFVGKLGLYGLWLGLTVRLSSSK